MYVTPKHSMLWLATQSKLLTMDKLMHLNIDRINVFYGTHLETEKHLLFQYVLSSSIWGQIKEWVRVRRSMMTIFSVLKWMKKEA